MIKGLFLLTGVLKTSDGSNSHHSSAFRDFPISLRCDEVVPGGGGGPIARAAAGHGQTKSGLV
jgi:hypothetical protein